MNVEFPCPENLQNMSKTDSGYHCHACEREVVDVSRMTSKEQEALSIVRQVCIVNTQYEPILHRQSIRSFALALILVFGTGLFSFANAQLSKDIKSLNDSLSICPVSQAKIIATVQHTNGSMLTATVVAILPNGKEEVFTQNEMGIYSFDIPAYALGKEIEIVVSKRNRTKVEYVSVETNEDTAALDFVFHGKKIARIYRTIGCPSF